MDPDPDPVIFLSDLQGVNNKIFFWVITFWRYIFIIFKDKVIKKSQNSRNQCFSYFFLLDDRGSGPGSISLTNGYGSGSRRPKSSYGSGSAKLPANSISSGTESVILADFYPFSCLGYFGPASSLLPSCGYSSFSQLSLDSSSSGWSSSSLVNQTEKPF